jgi:hypothetical protein
VENGMVFDGINKIIEAIWSDTSVRSKNIREVPAMLVKKQSNIFLGLRDVSAWDCIPFLV